MKPRNGQLRVGLAEGDLLSSQGHEGEEARPAGVGRIVREVCRRFARDVDWQHRPHFWRNGGGDGPGPGCRLTEEHEGLHSGRYISVNLVQASGCLVVRGGYYDRSRQPQAVYRQTVPLSEVTPGGLAGLLRQMHEGLEGHARRRFT